MYLPIFEQAAEPTTESVNLLTFDQKLAEWLNNNLNPGGWPVGNLILCAIALVLTVLLVGAIGIERERRGRTAGLRTHLLVGVGSCILMIISIYGFPLIPGMNRDVARLAAQVIAGVGFLGAGAIIHKNSGARGLTTAGTIWIAMAIGIACGSFNFILGTVGTLIILAVLISFRKVETKINERNPMIMLHVKPDTPALSKILQIAEEYECTVNGVTTELQEGEGGSQVEIVFQARFPRGKVDVNGFVGKIKDEVKPISLELMHNK